MKSLKILIKYFTALTGCVIYACGISLFLDPMDIAPGGVAGISVIIGKLASFPVGILIIIINIPIMIFGFFAFGKVFMLKTVGAMALSSVLIDIISEKITAVYGAPTNDLMLCALFGGALSAIGMGIVLKNGFSFGGTDIIVKALRQKYPHIKSGGLYLIIDMLIAAAAAVLFRSIELGMYSVVARVTSSLLLNSVLYGTDSAKLVYIISDRAGEISKALTNEYGLGVTLIEGFGAYSGKHEKVIMCVLKKHKFPELCKAIRRLDQNSFMIVSGASEIYGKGFKSHLEKNI